MPRRRPAHRISRLPALAVALGAAALGATACGSGGGGTINPDLLPREQSVSQLYNQAQQQLDAGNFIGAILNLEALLGIEPFGRYSEQASLDLMYARLLAHRTAGARLQAEQFLRVHPQHPNVDYAFFIRGMAAFMDDFRFASKFFYLDLARRDVTPVRQSFEELREYLSLFPESPYAPTARRRMLQLRELLARKEIVVAEYYLRRRASVAALNRANWALTRLPNSEMTPWALAVQVLAYRQMLLGKEAASSMQLLESKFPEHPAIAAARTDKPDEFALPSIEVTITELLTLGLFRAPQTQEAVQ